MSLLEVDLKDLGCKGGDKVLSKGTVFLLQTARELRRVPETVEETPKDLVRPLLRFPPLTTLTLFFILRHGLLRDLQVHDLEEKTAPRDKAVLSLLMLAQLEDDARRVRLED